MDARDAEHVALARRVTALLRVPDFRAMLSVRDADGGVPVVVAFADDTLGYVHERARALGGAANVVVEAAAGGGYAVVAMERTDSGECANRDHQELVDVVATTEVGMLIALLRQTRKTVHIRVAGEVRDAELIDADPAAYV